jgi:Ca-activated chloride channel family protein
MELTVAIASKDGSEKTEVFSRDEINIGRIRGNDVLLENGSVSKHHARVICRDGRVIVSDLQSTNGTFVNGRKLTGAAIVSPSDRVSIGDFVLRFTAGDARLHDSQLGSAAIPLVAVALEGEVVGARAHVHVEQRYRNKEARPIEAVYTFPLPSDAVVVGFALTAGGREVVAEVREREAAFRAYDDAIAAGHGAALLEQERRNVFTCNVGNVLPGEDVVTAIEYVERLVSDEGTVRMTIPTLVAPRYIPGKPAGNRTAHGVASPTDVVPDADRVSPPTGHVDYRATLDLAVRLGSGATVRCASHPITTRGTGDAVHVSFGSEVVPLDRDIVLAFQSTADGVARPGTLVHKGTDGKGYFTATFVPDLREGLREGAAAPAALNVVFVLDRSGSMGGASIAEARRALRLCLRNLREGDWFTILAFDDRLEPFSDELVPLTQSTLERADAWIESIDARGGTEMLQPLLWAAKRAPAGVVVLLTDGQVGNEDSIEREVMLARGDARFYCFGIGTNVSDALLGALAKRTHGAVERIYPGERIDEKVVAIFSRAVAARITAVSVTIRGVEVDELAPAPQPDLVDGEPWSIFGCYQGSGLGALEIRGKRGGEKFYVEAPLDFTDGSAMDPIVARFWAAERVRDLESALLDGRRAESNKARIIQLATLHRIASRYTSFVAVEKRGGERLAQGIPETRVVPVSAPAGWSMVRPTPPSLGGTGPTRSAGAPMMAGLAMPMGATPVYAAPMGAPAPGQMRAGGKGTPGGPAPAGAPSPAFAGAGAGRPSRSEAAGPDPVADLFARQLASGLWRGAKGDDPHAQVVATLQALRALLAGGLTRESPALAKYGKQLGKTADAVLAWLRAAPDAEASVASVVVAGLLALVPSPRGQRQLEEAVGAFAALSDVRAVRHDPVRLRALAEQA